MSVNKTSPLSIEQMLAIPLFTGLATDEIEALLDASQCRHIETGERYFLQGEPATAFYVLVHGRVRLTQITPDGRQIILRIIGPNEMFGAIAAMGANDYPASAEALSPCAALFWNGEQMVTNFERSPRLARNLMALMANHIQELQDRVREMATERVERRIAHTLLRLVRHAGRKVDGGVLLDLPLTRQDLAEMTGTTLYTVSRTLSQWEAQGITQNDRLRVLIRKPHELVAIAEDLSAVHGDETLAP